MYTIDKEQNLEKIDHVIKKAMNKVGVNETHQLCKFIPEKDGHHNFTLKRLKMHDTQTLEELLKKYILDQDAPKTFSLKPRKPYKKKTQKQSQESKKLEKIIRIVLLKKKLKEEKDLCQFLVDEEGLPINFKLFKQRKKNEPQRLRKLIESQIFNFQSFFKSSFSPQQKQLVVNQSNSPQNNREIGQSIEAFSLEKLCECAKTGTQEKPKADIFERALHIVRQELIRSIEQKQADQELWETYKMLVNEVR